MKAYQVTNHNQTKGGIVYAELNAAARRIGSKIYGNGSWESVTCKRAPWADEYQDRHIPKKIARINGLVIRKSLFARIFGL